MLYFLPLLFFVCFVSLFVCFFLIVGRVVCSHSFTLFFIILNKNIIFETSHEIIRVLVALELRLISYMGLWVTHSTFWEQNNPNIQVNCIN